MYILGISCYYHDAAAALLRDGELTAAAEEERFSRIKHDFSYPARAIQFCLESEGIQPRDLDLVVFYEKPLLKFERLLTTSLAAFPRSWKVFREAMLAWLADKLWIKTHIQGQLGVSADKVVFSEHHLSHAASCFLCSPFQEAAILTLDGVGEWATATMGRGRDCQIELFQQVNFPHSLGLLYSAFTAFLGFEVNEGEYKVMGMAPYGQPHYLDKMERLLRVERDGSFALDLDYFCFHHSTDRTYNRRFVELWGEPRDPQMHFFTEASGFPKYFGERPKNFTELARRNQHYADVAATIQRATEEAILVMARQAHERTGLENLCLAGGVALNSVANGRILRETPFRRLFVQPSAGDGGGALGAALFAYHSVLGHPRRFVQSHAYWGQQFSPDTIREFLERGGIPYTCFADEEKLLDRVVNWLGEGRVVGWFQGRSEWGPRALGNRSILADARNPEMKEIVNAKIKFREPYRPFAPSVQLEHTEQYFEIPEPAAQYPARFMLLVVPVQPEKREVIPAVTHVDGTGRLQTVPRESNPLYYRLIEKFGEATGVPVVLNTSFNLRGEPIVNTPSEAFSTFQRSEMDALVLGPYTVEKSIRDTPLPSRS